MIARTVLVIKDNKPYLAVTAVAETPALVESKMGELIRKALIEVDGKNFDPYILKEMNEIFMGGVNDRYHMTREDGEYEVMWDLPNYII
jgi:hypothetical protein